MRLFAVLTILLTSAAATYADGCRIIRQRVVKVETPVVAAVATYAVPYAVPLYSVGYDAGAGDIRELRLAIEELRKTVQELRLGPAVAEPKVDPLESKVLRVLGSRCASCHTGAEAKGKNVIFTAPGVLNPNVDKFLVWENADSGKMPPAPAPPIPDEEVRVLREWLTQAAQERRRAEALPNPPKKENGP